MTVKTKHLFLNALDLLEKTPKTNDKIQILDDNYDNTKLKQFLVYAIDQRIKFNISDFSKEVDVKYSVCRMGLSTWDNFELLVAALMGGGIAGNRAIAAVQSFLSICDDQEKKWYARCIQKDIASTKLGRKAMDTVWPGSVLYHKCMLADKEDVIEKLLQEDGDTFIGGYAYGELKKNGVRTFQETEDAIDQFGEVKFTHAPIPVSREGLPIENFKGVTQLMVNVVAGTKFSNYMFDGECSVDDSLEDTMSVYGFDFNKTDEDFMGKTGKVGKGWEKYVARREEVLEMQSRLKFSIIDILPLDEWRTKTCKKTYEERRADQMELKVLIAKAGLSHKIEILDSYKFETYTQARTWADKVISENWEGIIIKVADHLYQWTRHRSWTKIKEEVEVDAVIIDYIIQKQKFNGDGTLKEPMLGKFVVRDERGCVFEVGTGKGWTEDFYIDALINFREKYWKRAMKLLAQKLTEKSAVLPRHGIWRDDKSWQAILGEDYVFEEPTG